MNTMRLMCGWRSGYLDRKRGVRIVLIDCHVYGILFYWYEFWLLAQARNVNVSTRRLGQRIYTDVIPGEAMDNAQAKKEMSHLPAYGMFVPHFWHVDHHVGWCLYTEHLDHSHYLWYKRSLLQLTRLQSSSREGWQLRRDHKLVIKYAIPWLV